MVNFCGFRIGFDFFVFGVQKDLVRIDYIGYVIIIYVGEFLVFCFMDFIDFFFDIQNCMILFVFKVYFVLEVWFEFLDDFI